MDYLETFFEILNSMTHVKLQLFYLAEKCIFVFKFQGGIVIIKNKIKIFYQFLKKSYKFLYLNRLRKKIKQFQWQFQKKNGSY